jgi:hypothetical protein
VPEPCHLVAGYLLAGLLTRWPGGRLFMGLQGPGFRREYGWLLVAAWPGWWGLLACFLAHEVGMVLLGPREVDLDEESVDL